MDTTVTSPQLDRVASRLRQAGLRPTRQRLSLAALLFADGLDRHITAEDLYEIARRQRIPVSLATVYNTLNQFTAAGLLREVATEGHKAYFDTNTSDHQHYFVESEGRLIDIPRNTVRVEGLPQPPKGTRIGRVDVIIHLENED